MQRQVIAFAVNLIQFGQSYALFASHRSRDERVVSQQLQSERTGSARYLLPIAAPMAVLAVRQAPRPVEIRVDATFRAPGDQRDLGVVLLAAGFAPH